MGVVKLGRKGQVSIPTAILKRPIAETREDGAIVLRPAGIWPIARNRRKGLAAGGCNSHNGCMRTISSIDAKNRFGQLIEAAQRTPVTVTRKGRPAAVVLSIEDYERMRGVGWKRLLETMAAARMEAARRGLTDERLDALLADES